MFKKIIAPIFIILFSFSLLIADDIDEFGDVWDDTKIEVKHRQVETVEIYTRFYDLDQFDFDFKKTITNREKQVIVLFWKTAANGTSFIAHLEYNPKFYPYKLNGKYHSSWRAGDIVWEVDADDLLITEMYDEDFLNYYYREGLIKSFYWD